MLPITNTGKIYISQKLKKQKNMLRYNFPPGHVVIMIMTMWQPSVACLAFDMQHIYTNVQEYLGKHTEVLGIPLLLSPQRGLIGLLKFLNDNLSKPDQSIWKGMLRQTQTVFLPRPRGLQFLQLKADSQDGSSLQFPRKAPENDRTTAKKKATVHKSIAQSGTIKPSLGCKGGMFTFSRLRETQRRGGKKNNH